MITDKIPQVPEVALKAMNELISYPFVVNHDEALELAFLKREDSNLARCYIAARNRIEELEVYVAELLVRSRKNEPKDDTLTDEEVKAIFSFKSFKIAKDKIAELEEEIRYLRQYGNKECTNMADEARVKKELDK